MGRQMFAQGGPAYPMQDGGMAPMVAPQGPAPTMPGMPPAEMAGVDMDQAAQAAMAKGIDPAVLEGMLGQYSQQIDDLSNAEDYETAINSIRGDQFPMDARYAELAEIVGPEDAQSTPESVLTLIQPVLQMAAVDQGIGGLAQDAMSAPIEGELAGGIMSTVNMGEPEGPAPVNFNQGGAVQYMAPGGVAMPPVPGAALSPLHQRFNDRQGLYNSIIGPPSYDEADIEEERRMNQAQMLFDVAGTALAFATPGDRQMSAAQRLAQAATETQLFDKIGARAASQLATDRTRKKDTRDEKMKIDLMALQSAETMSLQDSKNRATSSARVPKPQQFLNKKTGDTAKALAGTTKYYKLMADDNFSLAGNDSIKPPSTDRITLYHRGDDKTMSVLASDPNIEHLTKHEGFTVVTTPSRDSQPKLDAQTIFVSDADRLAAYGGGYLNATETAQLEQVIGEMQLPTTTTVNGKTTTVGAKPLNKQLLDAIRARKKGRFDTTDFGIPEKQKTEPSALRVIGSLRNPDGTANTGAQLTAFQDYRNTNTGTLKRGLLDSPVFKQTLLNEGGTVDLSSEAWRMVPTQIYKAGVNYDMARGLSTIPDRVASVFNEVLRDSVGGRVSAEGLMIYQADNDFNALKTLTMGTIADAITDDRVLKVVQDQIMATLKPATDTGVLMFDAKARTAIQSVAGILATSLDEKVAILPEYGGNPQYYSDTEIRDARKGATKLRSLLAEYVQFGDQMDMFLSGEQGVGGRVGEPTVQQNRNVLYTEAQRQTGN